MILSPTLKTRFAEKYYVDPETGCWLWTAYIHNSDGYGRIYVGRSDDGRKIYEGAHRASWILHRGSIPEGLSILHYCDFTKCVNPDHLFLGTESDNSADMMSKGRWRGGWVPGENHPNAKLTNQEVEYIRNSGETGPVLASKFGLSIHYVYDIKSGKYRRAG